MNTILAFVRRDAKIALSYQLSFWLPWLSIIVSVAGFNFVSKLVTPSPALGVHGRVSTYFTYVIVNVTFTVLLSSALQSFAGIIRRDQLAGTLEPILVTAPDIPLVMIASGVWSLTIAGLQVAVYVASAFAFGLQLDKVNVLSIVVFAILGIACMGAIGLIAAALVIAYKQPPPANVLVGGAASMLAGVLFPTSLLPWPLQIVSWCLPLTHALAGMRGGIAGIGLGALASDAWWLCGATVLLVPLALFVIGRAIDHARRDGTLAYY
jgi:ABC-type polysaccharide/polyol phosphate export permease